MKKLLATLPLLLVINLLQAQTVCTLESRKLLDQELSKLSTEKGKHETIQEWVIEIGKDFLGTPYVEKTLEIPGPEQLVINLQGVDCTTFLESVVTLARMTEMDEISFERFEKELEKIRYRAGKNIGYPSRLHYFTEWIVDNQKKGVLKDITAEIGGITYPNRPSFMSENPKYYSQLSDPGNVEKIKEAEAEISKYSYSFIPKEQIQSLEKGIQSGDLIAITTPMANLDVVHVGFAISQNGRIHLLHASSKNKAVEISALPLHEYLATNRGQSGIMVARLSGN
ncbi:N-acetylmuramoyl-L-alanine amidase-like domain-containing protein [Algoriphagus mannitolivorans]|uniref:N-acetylmuramoyl-L-alanine amidase-like domain-containing protein n=1 Tax=Algoriphagus mannitolivorans TaxID=226504 RepID=UPI00047E1733|nr:N-acetylmuramoyl-L-alanine amidase-like domain-containing protein [Algoriphagus mannitolivorans]